MKKSQVENILSNKEHNNQSKTNISEYLKNHPYHYIDFLKIAIKENDLKNVEFLLSLPYSVENECENIFHIFLKNNNFNNEMTNVIINGVRNNEKSFSYDIFSLFQKSDSHDNTPLTLALSSENIDALKFVISHNKTFLIKNNIELDQLFQYFKKYTHEHNNEKDRSEFLNIFDSLEFEFSKNVSFNQKLSVDLNYKQSNSPSTNLIYYLYNQDGKGLNFISKLLERCNNIYLSDNLFAIYDGIYQFSDKTNNKIQNNEVNFKNFTDKFIYNSSLDTKSFLHSIICQPYFTEYLNHPAILSSAKKNEHILSDLLTNRYFFYYLNTHSFRNEEVPFIMSNLNELINIYPDSVKNKLSPMNETNLFDQLEKTYTHNPIIGPVSTLLLANGFKYYRNKEENNLFNYNFIGDVLFGERADIANAPEKIKNRFNQTSDGYYKLKTEFIKDNIHSFNDDLLISIIRKYDVENSIEISQNQEFKKLINMFIYDDTDATKKIESLFNSFYNEKIIKETSDKYNLGPTDKKYLVSTLCQNIYNGYVFFKDNYSNIKENVIYNIAKSQYENIIKHPYYIPNPASAQLEKLFLSKQLDMNEINLSTQRKKRM